MTPKVVVSPRDPRSGIVHDFSGVVSRAAMIAGVVYLLGSLLDLGILWFAQNPGNLQFEFVALTRTTEAFPRLLVSTALIYIGLYVGKSVGPGLYKLLAVWVLVLGFGALAVLMLLGLNYAGMSANVTEEGRPLFHSALVKAGGLSVLYVVSLLPLGLLGFGTRKR